MCVCKYLDIVHRSHYLDMDHGRCGVTCTYRCTGTWIQDFSQVSTDVDYL